MDWADELASRVSGPQVVNDSKTPSGTVHVGSLRGPVILDVIARALRARGIDTTLLYGVDDLDPMDAQALLTPDAVEHEMGRPLAHVPDQAGDCHASYARHHAQVFIDTFAGLGIRPDRYYWMSDIYPTGALDPYIRIALDRADTVREVYARVANVRHPSTWHPLGLICETCGKVGTTIVTKWDGERVFYECRADLVAWARGCGSSGWTSPFGGRAKLPWNLEWAAQWSLFGVTIEPCGKDLSTAGGSRERSDAIAREVFERELLTRLPAHGVVPHIGLPVSRAPESVPEGWDVESPVQAEVYVVWLNGEHLELTSAVAAELEGLRGGDRGLALLVGVEVAHQHVGIEADHLARRALGARAPGALAAPARATASACTAAAMSSMLTGCLARPENRPRKAFTSLRSATTL